MKKFSKRFLLIIIVVISFLFSGCRIYSEYANILRLQSGQHYAEETGTPRIEQIETVQVIHLYGKPYEMGFQYGNLLKGQLKSLVYIVQGLFPEKSLRKYLAIAMEAEGNLSSGFKDELQGVVDASGIDYNYLLALNLIPMVDCSVLAVWDEATPDRELIMGRNADYIFGDINKAIGLIVVKHPEKGNSTIMATFLGMLGGFTGMNDKGVCYGNMLVNNSETKKIDTGGLPIQLLMQEAGQEYRTARQLINSITSRKHMIPINLMVADTKEALLAELNQTSFAIREGSRGVLAASNYFYSSGMFTEPADCDRFAGLMTDAKNHYGTFTVEEMKESLHKARRRNGQNMQSVIFQPAKNKMLVSMNRVPATLGPYIGLDVYSLFKR